MKKTFSRFCLALALLSSSSVGGRAQFAGFMAQQTTTQTFSITMTASSANFGITVTNVGQAAHMVEYKFAGSTNNGCAFFLDASFDNVTFRTLAVGTDFFSSGMTYANGYYAFLRLKVNPLALAACNTVVLTAIYTGFQNTIPVNQVTQNAASNAVASPAAFFPNIKTPQIVNGFQCFNPNASTAFLEEFESATTPTLGTGVGYSVGIAAGATFVFPGPPFVAQNKVWFGAATTSGGAVAVATALTCSLQMNLNGPFYPITLVSP